MTSNDRGIGNAQLWRVKKIIMGINNKFSGGSKIFKIVFLKMVWIDSMVYHPYYGLWLITMYSIWMLGDNKYKKYIFGDFSFKEKALAPSNWWKCSNFVYIIYHWREKYFHASSEKDLRSVSFKGSNALFEIGFRI